MKKKITLLIVLVCGLISSAAAQQFSTKAPTAADWAAMAKLPDFNGVWERGGGGGAPAGGAARGNAPGAGPAAGAAPQRGVIAAGGAGQARGAAPARGGGGGRGGPSF